MQENERTGKVKTHTRIFVKQERKNLMQSLAIVKCTMDSKASTATVPVQTWQKRKVFSIKVKRPGVQAPLYPKKFNLKLLDLKKFE